MNIIRLMSFFFKWIKKICVSYVIEKDPSNMFNIENE